MPVNKKLKLLVAWAICRSMPTKKSNRGVSKMPPTPTVPIKVPLNNPIKIIVNIKIVSQENVFAIIPY